MLTSYSENLRVRYVSQGCSKATLLNTVICLTAIIFPYLICYRTQGFWIRLERFKEQPQILWKHETLVILDAKDADGQQESLIWTTLPGLKSMVGSELAPFVTSREADTNFDSIRDFLDIAISIPIPNNLSIYGMHMILLFEYKLQKYAMLEMESMIFASKEFGRRGNQYEFIGDIGLVQKEPLWNRFVDKRYNYEVIPRYSSRLEDYSMSNIVRGYTYRNVTTILKHNYELWLNVPQRRNEFTIKGRINYVQETYECWSSFGEMLKWAWVQYLSFFVITFIILKKFQGMIHRAKIFDTYLVVPWEKRLGTQPTL